MRKGQENKITMFVSVLKVCETNRELLTQPPALNATYLRFVEKVKSLQEMVQANQIRISGVTDTKSSVTEEIIDKSLEIAGLVHAYANVSKDQALKARTDFSRSKLDNLRDTTATETYRQILADAKSVSDKLLDYGISDKILNEYEDKIDEYAKIVSAPREAIVERKSTTERLPELIGEVDNILFNELDRFMEIFRGKNQGFYLSYFSAREIVDAGLRKEKDKAPAEEITQEAGQEVSNK